ncbi:hypothetical protein JQ543_14925 [Bradyrhizobium diazoefficiens]|nr:hypothetical protein [Bradyrhizobium diazoefficiens]MBR0849043.1 hypothetical protein [Bradyrhizobium diazoefficiens]
MIVSVSCDRIGRNGGMLTGEGDDLKCRLAVATMSAGYLANLILIGRPAAPAL